MILIHYIEGRYIPIIACDICEKRIVDGQLAAIVFRSGDPSSAELLPCLHAHKGACHDAAEQKFGGKENSGWQELQTHLLYLVLNTRLSPEILARERDTRDAAGYFP